MVVGFGERVVEYVWEVVESATGFADSGLAALELEKGWGWEFAEKLSPPPLFASGEYW